MLSAISTIYQVLPNLLPTRLYVSVSSAQLAEGSKRAFVSLLEYAEEELEVSHVVACLDRWEDDLKSYSGNS